MTNTYEGKSKANSNNKFVIVVSKFNEFITEKLLDGCLQTLLKNGANEKNIDIVKVPGAFEIPTAAKNLLDLNKYNAVICLGCVIRGETSHYDHICNAISTEINYLGVLSGMPVIFGVLTCENLEQAQDRSGGKVGNKGSEAALAAIEMVSLLQQVKSKTLYDSKV
ncbi:MAG: 6,7-dimethyl-8-ribityllumazine synthase [Candidatus Melainabacteria bacterium]|nr:6,7-dimethyl-8-ribityllumazine synthase [Candidatus Melainabacteria bacterium]